MMSEIKPPSSGLNLKLDGSAFLSVGLIAAVALVFGTYTGAPPWVIFLSWVGYGVLAGSVVAAPKFLLTFVVGIAAGYGAVWLGCVLPFSEIIAAPIGLGLVCGLIAILIRYPPFDLVPVYFLGMISFYGSASSIDPSPWFMLLLAGGAGVSCGLLATFIQRIVDRSITEDEPFQASKR